MRWLAIAAACAPNPEPRPVAPGEPMVVAGPSAEVRRVQVTGAPGALTFGVTVVSDETGCASYADWWEVLTPEGSLLYRRILNHSHPGEQPFTRDGGPVPARPDQEVIVRAHHHPGGYGRAAMKGSASAGFSAVALDDGFAWELEWESPLPVGCAF